MFARITAMLAAVVITLGISLAVAPVASADPPFTIGAVTHNCGNVTCSVYVSRSGTRSIDQFLDNTVAEGGSCAAETAGGFALGHVPYVGIPLGLYCGFRFEQIDMVLDEAAEKNKCFKVTYLRRGGAVTHISTNNGDYCKN